MKNRAERIAALSVEKRERLRKWLERRKHDVADAPLLRKRNEPGPFPLSFAQERLWFLDQFEPGNPAYNTSLGIRFTGALDTRQLENSLNEILQRHDILRTSIRTAGDRPVQVVSRRIPLPFEIVRLNHISPAERQHEFKALAVQEARKPFVLSEAPLFRCKLFQLDRDTQWLLITLHHTIQDGWSNGIVLQELIELYDAFSAGKPSPLPDLSIQYSDYTTWQRERLRGAGLREQLEYWKRQLSGNLPTLSLPTDRRRPPIQTYFGKRLSRRLPLDLTASLLRLSEQSGVTLFMTLLATLKLLLYRYSGQHDIIVGSPVANRQSRQLEALIGCFVNTLALRTQLDGDMTFLELLENVKKVCLEAYQHQELAFEMLVAELEPIRDPSRTPLFQVMFVLQNQAMPTAQLKDLEVDLVRIDNQTAKTDLSFIAVETDESLILTVEYRTCLFDTDTVERMMVHFEQLLKAVVTNPEKRISDWSLSTAPGRHELFTP